MTTNTAPAARAPSFVGAFNPLAHRLLGAGVHLGPNALITIRGRKSGVARTTPVALVERNGDRWVIGTFGEVNWVRNLRAAGAATLTVGKRQEEVIARELPLEEGAEFFTGVLGPYVHKLPMGRLLLRVLGAREILEDPIAAAKKRPVFELRAA